MGNKARFFCKSVWRRTTRTPVKSLLFLLIAVLLLNAYGQLLQLRERYRSLCEDTVIDANFLQAMTLGAAKRAEDQDFCDSLYYEAQLKAERRGEPVTLVLTNNVERWAGGTGAIEYGEGCGPEVFRDLGDAVLISRALQVKSGLQPGDSLLLVNEGRLSLVAYDFYRRDSKTYQEQGLSQADVAALYREEIQAEVDAKSEIYRIVGVIDLPAFEEEDYVFTPGRADSVLCGVNAKLEFAQVRLSSYIREAELKEYGQTLAKANNGRFVMDTEKLDGPANTLRLLERLCPAAVAVALVIDMAAVGLLTAHGAQSISLMRMMGEKRRRVLLSFLTEQALLAVLGLALGLGLAAYFVSAEAFRGCVIFAGLYFAAALAACGLCVGLITRKSPLELLQTKE